MYIKSITIGKDRSPSENFALSHAKFTFTLRKLGTAFLKQLLSQKIASLAHDCLTVSSCPAKIYKLESSFGLSVGLLSKTMTLQLKEVK